jgi:hypothetical protein
VEVVVSQPQSIEVGEAEVSEDGGVDLGQHHCVDDTRHRISVPHSWLALADFFFSNKDWTKEVRYLKIRSQPGLSRRRTRMLGGCLV